MIIKKEVVFLGFIVLAGLLLAYSGMAVSPTGASVTTGTPETGPSGIAGNASAYAGNITGLVVFSPNSISQAWQGFYGNVSGGLRLANAADEVLYNWSLASPQGEVYSSTNSTVSWPNIQCFNFTALGNYTDETGNGGTTNLYGTNLTILEERFNINSSDRDSVNYTFRMFNHDSFLTSSQLFSADECRSIQLFNSTGVGQDGVFEEVLLYEPVTTSVVFTSILEDSGSGFNNAAVDFEMIVLEDGHGSDTDATTYFFYVELE